MVGITLVEASKMAAVILSSLIFQPPNNKFLAMGSKNLRICGLCVKFVISALDQNDKEGETERNMLPGKMSDCNNYRDGKADRA